MPVFQDEFEANKGRPILYKGKMLSISDDFPIDSQSRFRVTFEQCNGDWRQGMVLRTHDEGRILINGQQVRSAVCWHDTAPNSFEFDVVNGAEPIEVYNVWDRGNGVTDAWTMGAAMIVEELENGRRYRCNDGEPDDDFDDIVFRIERVEPSTT